MTGVPNICRQTFAVLLFLIAVAATSSLALAAGAPLALDPSFGEAGVVSGGTARSDYREAAGLAIDGSGKILVVGVSDSGAAIARYLPDGQLDPTYGEGGIAALKSVPVTSGLSIEAVRGINGLAVDGVGEALVLWQGTKLTRFTSTGALDTSYGAGGTATVAGFRFNALTTLANGSVLLAGYGYGSPYMVAAKLRPDGSLDDSFGKGGFAAVAIGPRETNAAARRVAVRGNGKIVLAGFSHGHPALVQLLADGRPDPGFGHRGRVVAPGWLRGEATALGLAGGGRTLVSCRCSRSGSKSTLLPLLRYTAAGRLDSSFSKPTLDHPVRQQLRPNFLLQSAGKIVLVGTGSGPSIRLFDGQGRPATSTPGAPRDRAFGVFAALQGTKPLVAWTPEHRVGQAELKIERFRLR
ncbi:MAG TPA: hypothetical protein VFI17_03395 [Solirubrobacterales bacterium]|nr:hypothetical protein [Solirubrobacterales bacterium]